MCEEAKWCKKKETFLRKIFTRSQVPFRTQRLDKNGQTESFPAAS